MKVYTKRMLAWVLAAALLITCGISGLVLPAAADDGNLFVNGDFEQGATAEWQSSALIVSGQGKDGGWGYYQDRTETNTNTGTGLVRYKKALLSQMEAGTAYILSFDYKTSGDAQAQLYLDRGFGNRTDTEGTLKGGVTLTKSVDTWTTMSIPFTTPTTITAGTGYEFAIRAIGGVGGVWYDNFKLVKAPTAATAITLDKTALSMTAGDTAVLTATTAPEGAAAAIVWSTSDANVATVADGTVTAVAAGTATITATCGTLTATCTVTVAASQPEPEPSGEMVMPNGDFSAETSGWMYASTVEGLFNKGDAVPVQTDADGNRYIQIPANGMVITGPTVEYEIKANDWVRVSFKVRKTAAGKMRFGVRLQGGMYAGYAQPDWTMATSATATSGDGEWFVYTVYAQAASDATKLYLQMQEISANTTADLTLDLDDVELTYLGAVTEESLNLLPDGTMDVMSWNMNSYSYAGFFNDGAEIVADPDDATNSVMHIPAGTSVQAWVMPSTRILPPKTATAVKKNTVYKLTYRMKGAGTTSVGSNSSYGEVLQTTGEPGTASETWKTVTVYLKTKNSVNANYTFDFRNSGEVYLDDMQIYEVTGADSLTLDKTTAELLPGDEVTLTATTTPPGLTPVWTTSDANVATVADGKVTAVAAGTATITATIDDKTATFTVTVVDPGEATAIALNKTEIYLVKGSSETLTVTTEPTASRYDSLSWTTSDATLATVADGVVTAAADKEGAVTITATAMVGETPLTATCKVIVVGNATNIEANVETLHLAESTDNGKITVSETIDLTVTPTGAYTGTLSWTTSDAAVATVDENGKVTAHAAGTATITVSNGTLSDTVTVTVDTFGERITGGDFEDNDWNTAYWTTNVIKDDRGTLVADPTNEDNTVLSIPGKSTAGWYLWPAQVNAGRTYKLTYNAMNAEGKAVVYFEGGKSVISGAGWQQKTVAKEGWTEVTHIFTMYGSGINRNYTIAFGNQVASTLYIDDISLVELPEATALELTAGDTFELMPTGTATMTAVTVPAEASAGTLTWTTSDASIVSVSDKGVITAMANSGSAVITVTNDKGLTDSVTVTVNEYANLLENGDFEQGANRWGGDWAAEMIQPGIGKDGSYGFKAHNTTGNARGEAYYKKAIPVQPATTYILTFDYYATENSKQLRIYSTTLNIGSKYAANGDGEWKTATKIFTTKADMSLHTNFDLAIVVDGEGGEDVVIDNICLKLYDTGVEATSIKLNYETLTLMPGRTGALTINPYPTDGNINRATWTSSNEDVATVEYGVVTAVGKGAATITTTLRNGLSATCEVTVSGEEAYIKNGTFADTEDWTVSGESAIADGVGAVAKDGTISQTVTGLKPDTTYQLFVRYRSENSSKLGIDLINGETALLDASEAAGTTWTKKAYEFTTPATLADTSTLTFAVDSGNGPVYIDHILLAQKATLVDLKVDSVVWTDSEQVKPGTELSFAVTFTNYGEDAIKAGSTIDIDICVDSKPIQTLTYTVGNAGFASGDTDMIIGTEKWVAVEGDHVVSARINSTMSVLEMNVDNNNTVQADLRVSNEILPVPEIAENAGFNHLTFSDDFNSLHTIDQYGTGADGYKWYITRPYSAPNVETDDYSIENGVMNLRLKSPNYNYGLGTIDIKTGLGYEFQYGYMEFRVRMHDYDSDKDGGPAIWSLPYDKLVNQCTRWVEMDWLEYWGTPSYAKDGRYTVTMHDNTMNDPAGEHWYRNPNHAINALGDQEWHVLGYLWDHGVVIAYLDGEEVMRQTYDPEDGVWPAATVASGEDPFPADAYQPMNTHALPVTICGSLDNQMDIDYIRIWTGAGGGSIPEGDSGNDGEGDGELGEGDIIVDIAADEFWHNYCTDDWGDPIKTIDEYNYTFVVEGALYWPLLSAERQAEINALLKENGQPTFEELAAAVDEFMTENPATVFVDMFLKDENGEPIMEATVDNFEQLLASALVFVELDTDTQLAIVELMAANGQPRYDELLMQALAIAEEQGWTDFEVPEVEVPTPEDIPATGATGIPAALAVALLVSAAALTVLRKRTAK